MEIEKYNFDQECGMQEHYSLGYFYSCKDIDPLLEELETLRASNTIKQANIERLEAENAKLIAEREAMMKQGVFAVIAKYPDVKEPKILSWNEMPDGEHWVYAHPLPAQQIPTYAVATGEVSEGCFATYTLHDLPPPMCDYETLYRGSPQAQQIPV